MTCPTIATPAGKPATSMGSMFALICLYLYNYSRGVTASVQVDTQELHCNTCHGVFVEAQGQDIESFLSLASSNPESANHISSTPSTSDAPLFGVPELDALLAAAQGSATGQPPTLLRRISGTSGRPMTMLMYSGVLPEMQNNGRGRSLDDLIHHLMMSETSHRSFGTMPSVIDSLERVYVTDSSKALELGSCGISMDELVPGDVAIKLPCRHVYKEDLIVQWLKSNHTCPTCRYEFPLEE